MAHLIKKINVVAYMFAAPVSLADFCLLICFLSQTIPKYYIKLSVLRVVSFVSFLILETSIGLYFPSIGCLRSQLIPESHRATVTNWFRVPMNLITWYVEHNR